MRTNAKKRFSGEFGVYVLLVLVLTVLFWALWLSVAEAKEYTLVIQKPEAEQSYVIEDTLILPDGTSLETEGPLVPLRQLAEWLGVPVEWRVDGFGGLAVWQGEVEVGFRPGVDSVLVFGEPQTIKIVYEKPWASNGRIWLPVSLLEEIGLAYRIEWEECQVYVFKEEAPSFDGA